MLRPPMLPAERRQHILRAVRGGTAHVSELAERFAVSEMTVRRDLRELELAGKLERVHGGALSSSVEPPFAQIAVEHLDVKDRIGRAAADLVQDGQTVMIDIGTTTLQVACHLRGRKVTVITSNLAAFEELAADPDIELILPGGIVRRNYRSLVGVLAEDTLRQLHADIAFLGASGITQDLSVMDSTMIEVPIKRAMLAAADRAVLCVDAGKFAMGGVVRVCAGADLDTVVTDTSAPAQSRSAFEEAGVEVLAV
jgi:DeoR/GlpR family transcriptional regulator of sugar metabolism